MSTLFMRGTELAGLEQMMMSTPGFTKRGYKQVRIEDHAFNDMSYKKLINSIRKDINSLKFQRRLQKLIKDFKGNLFISDSHKREFYKVFLEENNSVDIARSSHIAVIYLLTSDEKLWQMAKKETDSYRCNFNAIKIKGIDVEAYALYKTAKTISLGLECIKLNELEDDELVDEVIFETIIHAMLLSKYGSKLFQINLNLEDREDRFRCQERCKKHAII